MPRKREKPPYSKGEINKIIDSLLHPWIKQYPWLIGIDGLLHGLVEGDPAKSLEKFVRYNGPKLVRELGRQGR